MALTGKIRFRTHKPLLCETLLVLQVEYQVSPLCAEYLERGFGPIGAEPCYWRDAKVEDLVELSFNPEKVKP